MLLEYRKSYISFRSGPNPHKNHICSAEYLDLDVAASGDLLALDALHRRLLLVIFVGFLGAPLGFGLVGGTGLGLGLPLPRLKSSSLGEASSASHLSAWPPSRCLVQARDQKQYLSTRFDAQSNSSNISSYEEIKFVTKE